MSRDHQPSVDEKALNRRDFVKLGAVAGAGATMASFRSQAAVVPSSLGQAPESPFTAPPVEEVRMGYVGVGGMGSGHVRNLLQIEGCRIAAVEAGFPKPAGYVLGDVNTSLIQTVKGKSIVVVHDTNLPRPYSRINLVQGTRGIAEGYPDRIFIEGRSEGHEYERMSRYYKEYDHPLWKALNDEAAGAGHGGMDFIEDYRLIKCLREGLPLDMDVYDAAAWSAVSELSERSVANRSQAVDFPDFTRGRWKTWQPLGIVGA